MIKNKFLNNCTVKPFHIFNPPNFYTSFTYFNFYLRLILYNSNDLFDTVGTSLRFVVCLGTYTRTV